MFYDDKNVDKLEDMEINDPRIIEDFISELKIYPYDIIIRLKNKCKEYDIKENCYTQNNLNTLNNSENSKNIYVIQSDYLNVKVSCSSQTKNKAKQMASQNFLYKIYPDYNWVGLVELFTNNKK